MMRNLKLEGETLGQKHKYYNKLLKEVTSTNALQEIQKIDYNEPDIDNLFKIDVACRKQDVDYILEVLKCEDMLYVSRAIKQSIWLITDTKYADIINPEYLHGQLLPQMTSKAGNKLMLTIRLNLKDEKRVEQFHKYYEENYELKVALKWLPNCSISYIENSVEKHASDIPFDFIKRLCEKSISILEICMRKVEPYLIRGLLSKTTFLLNNDAEKFVAIINSQNSRIIPKLSAKSTQIIMKTKPDIILDNFEKFSSKIHIPTFVKFLKSEDIKDFLLKHSESFKSLFTFDNIKHFILRMPTENRFDFVKRVCIEKSHHQFEDVAYDDDMDRPKNVVLFCAAARSQPSSNANIYKWYKFAPFSIALTDLKKLIRVESNPNERNEIFRILISCAKRDPQNLYTLLQYYRNKHMNEPFKFKSHFMNIVLSQSGSHRFDEKTWSIINDIFSSMDVYNENENNVQSCLKYIIVYKVVHDLKVPDIVEKKFEFDTLKSFQTKLNNDEKHKVFNYLYQILTKKIENLKMDRESDCQALVTHITNMLNLLNDWKKSILEYTGVIEKIKEIIKIKDMNETWEINLSGLYNINKSWRKHMFKESLVLHPMPETCLNALKHGPEILDPNEKTLYLNDSAVSIRFLSKLRTYWPETLAMAYENIFRNQIDKNINYSISVRGLCVLLSKTQLTNILNKYKPKDTKINWTETEDLTLNILKAFAKNMHLARPHPPVEIMLSYANGDYLQFVLPSVHSILFNMSRDQSIKHIPTLLDAPVSLQKHGLKVAFTKLNVDELLPTCLNTWKSTKNSSIRAIIFKLVFDLLCKEKQLTKMKEIWHVLDTYIDDLTAEENRIIYVTLGRARDVPLPVKEAYCVKSYRYLKSLPAKANCERIASSVIDNSLDVMETIDVDFIVEVVFQSFDTEFAKKYYNCCDVISAHLLSTKTDAIQRQRYEKIFVPLFEKYLEFLKNTKTEQYYIKYNFKSILDQVLIDFENISIDKNMITPVKLFKDIHSDLEKMFSNEDYYVLIMTWNLAAKYMEIIEKLKNTITETPSKDVSQNESDNSKANIIYLESAPHFGKICMEQLKKEIRKYFPSICRLFTKAVIEIFDQFRLDNKIKLAICKAIQQEADIVEGYLMMLELIPDYLEDDKDKEDRNKMFEVLSSHPSNEVRIHYQQMLRDKGLWNKNEPTEYC